MKDDLHKHDVAGIDPGGFIKQGDRKGPRIDIPGHEKI